MNKKDEFPRRNNNNNYTGGKSNQGRRGPQEQYGNRDRNQTRGYQREGYSSSRGNYSQLSSPPRYNHKPRESETVDDIKMDIARIEKEIELEIKEIRSMRLGL